MAYKCADCDGYGQVISERSVRQGHTHSNDPDREDVPCETCEGSGERAAVPSDLDGLYASYRGIGGYLTWFSGNDTLMLDADNGLSVINLKPEHVQCLS